MRRTSLFLLLCLVSLTLTGCAASSADTNAPAVTPEPLKVDLDLSRLSGTVVYAQVYNLVSDYEAWLGKVIRMSGYYSTYEDTERGVVYHACVIPDATACCAQGIEFVRAGEYTWPDEYPEELTDITVTGRVALYEEDGTMYLHLEDAELVWENGT